MLLLTFVFIYLFVVSRWIFHLYDGRSAREKPQLCFNIYFVGYIKLNTPLVLYALTYAM